MQKRYCFLSNYLTHHQLPFCLEMMKLTDGCFTFVETDELPQERKNMGYATLGDQYDFVIHACRSKTERKQALQLAYDADVVIIGSAPDTYIRKRLKANKLTFRYSERIFKRGLHDVLRLAKYTAKTLPYRNKNLYYMLSSAYAAHDYYCCGAKVEKLFKWGYFPATRTYENIEDVLQKKAPNTLLWTARLIDWKHPEVPVQIAARLKKEGYDFHLNMIGVGPMEQEILRIIEKENLQEQVQLLGAMSPERVREEMEKHQIFLFTSDYNEGWGAVLNEAMNSGCAVVASHACGSVPFMVKSGENGYIYRSGDVEQLFELTKSLLEDPELCTSVGKHAISSVDQVWNAACAAKRLVDLCDDFRPNIQLSALVQTGVMSAAQPIPQVDMYLYTLGNAGS